jgi:aminobenzoyl-glutamate utilization protein B
MDAKRGWLAFWFAAIGGWPLGTAVAADHSALKATAAAYVDAQSAVLAQTSRAIWSYAETSLEESKSSAVLQDLLQASGFEIEAGVAGMPTAFVASYGSGAPIIGILAEFDALPGVSQAAVPTPQAGPNPLAGHACGHSVFGAGSAGAALALADLMRAGKLTGTLRLYGTPAEETGVGKVYMLRAGLFDDVDVMLGWHPGSMTLVPYGTSMALVNVKVRFRGSAAHAAAQPYAGRSALDAVELMNMGVNMMREHVKDDARIHYVITNGGGQPNVVPPEAEVWYYIRAYKFTDVVAYFERFKEIAAGAAQMTQTQIEAIEIQSEIHEMVPVRSLAEVMHANLTAIGPPAWSEADLAFARATQENYAANALSQLPPDAPALHAEILPLPPEPIKGSASTDIGDISWFVPVGNVMVAGYGYGLPTHSWPVVAASGSSIGDRALVVAAKAIAATAIDLYRDPELLATVQADFKATRGDAPWQTLIPEGQQAPRKVR